MKNYKCFLLLAVIPILFVIIACQDIFTFSPFSGMQRDPSAMTAEQKINYAEDALASGDEAAMEKAYAAIKEMADDDTDNTEVNMLAAELAVELSGVPEALEDLVMSEDPEWPDVDNPADLETYINTNFPDVDADKMIEAYTYYGNVEAEDAGELDGMDKMMYGLGWAFNDIETGPVSQDATDMVEEGLTDLGYL